MQGIAAAETSQHFPRHVCKARRVPLEVLCDGYLERTLSLPALTRKRAISTIPPPGSRKPLRHSARSREMMRLAVAAGRC
jgi:hypothetical protein